MKCFFSVLAALLVTSAVYADDLYFMDKMIECAGELGMSPDDLKTAINNNDSKLGCVNACVLKKLGAMEDGKITVDKLNALLESHKDSFPNHEKIKDNLTKCHAEATSGGDLPECELAGKFAMCMHKSAM